MPDLILDNLIFDLQPHGGVTSVWEGILAAVGQHEDLDAAYLQSLEHRSRLQTLVGEDCITIADRGPLLLRRFRKPRLPKTAKVFHSSYFRVADHAKNIVTVHDCISEKFDRGLRRTLHATQKKKALRNAEFVVCVSDSTRRDLLDFYPWLDRDIVSVVHNGIDLDYFTPASIEHQNALLYVGSRGIHKNFSLALHLTASELAVDLDLVLEVVGGGEATQLELETIEQLGLRGRVRFLGAQNVGGVRDAYRRAFALVYPSFYEGFGIPPLEAMACGCPVLVSNSSSLPEVVGEAAETFNPRNLLSAIGALERLSYQGRRQELVEAGSRRAALFPKSAMGQKMVDLYRRAMA